MEIYDFSVAPGAVREIHCGGSYVYFYSGSAGGADATISLKHDASGERILLQPGQAFRIEGGTANRWIVENYAGAATIVGRLVIGNGRIDDNRITGSVDVIDGGKTRTYAGQAFTGFVYTTPVAAQYPHVQLWNPTTTKRAIVSQVIVGGSASQTNYISRLSTQIIAGGSGAQSKRLGGSASLMLLKTTTNATQLFDARLAALGTAVNDTKTYKLTEPIIIDPGQGLTLNGSTVNQDMYAVFEFFEEAI